MVVNGAASGLQLVTSAVPQGLILGPVPFSVFINNQNAEVKCTITKFADDIKQGGAADSLKRTRGLAERSRYIGTRAYD